MTGYILSRVLRAIITLLITVSLVFIFIRFSGDPAAALAPPDAPQEVIDQYARAMGLDQPLWQQYTSYIGGLFRGEFGYSIHTGRPVEALFLDRLPYTLHLGLTALSIALVLGIALGAIAAINRGRLLDRAVMGFSVFAFAMPNFLFGLCLILIGALVFQVFLAGASANVLFPALTLGLAAMGSFARFARSSLLETINAPFMRAAEARGIPFARRLILHAAPNAAIPLVTLVGLSLGALIAGSVVTEQVFAWPGVGQLLVRSVATRDIATVQFLVLAVAFTMIMANLIVDLLYLVIDPRIRVK
ncbi:MULTISPECIES: ABC transporter permease [Paracoccaceae]|jgi:peptide/nickel transport system permease protein|uniref:ABC transporter permease n=1 Tax=Rhodobacterales TaxID=204455 RepID=UPI001B2755A0|nr:ABC transporter permease [Boseongicola sp. H5]MBO6603919.1 ABC transporter permease [Roseicyclus sp.]MBO6624879.1 ABC transporter permease [Roseicyclus sp.]MBO6924210.1 ABC transporter permease [Roseicyclus sp.]